MYGWMFGCNLLIFSTFLFLIEWTFDHVLSQLTLKWALSYFLSLTTSFIMTHLKVVIWSFNLVKSMLQPRELSLNIIMTVIRPNNKSIDNWFICVPIMHQLISTSINCDTTDSQIIPLQFSRQNMIWLLIF